MGLRATFPRTSSRSVDSKLVVFSENTKSRKYRYVPLSEAALEAVRALPPLEDCPFVFYDRKTRARWRQCRYAWEKAREAVSLPEIQAKDLRRYYAIHFAESGADMHDIQQVLGHSSVAMTERHHARFSPKHSAKKILKILEGGKSLGGSSNRSPARKQNGMAPTGHSLSRRPEIGDLAELTEAIGVAGGGGSLGRTRL